jgi:hypothetical protein
MDLDFDKMTRRIEERQPLATLKLQSFKPMVEAVAASTDGIIATII